MLIRALVLMIATLLPALSQAELFQVDVTFELQLARVPSIVTTATGVAEVEPGYFFLPPGLISIDTVKPLTVAGVPAVEVTLANAGSGIFDHTTGTSSFGQMRLPGLVRYCLISAACDAGQFLVPLVSSFGWGVGQGGVFTFGSFAHGPASLSSTGGTGTLQGASWGIGPVTASGFAHFPTSGSTPALKTASGFAHGPASASSSVLQTSGVIQLVTPFQTVVSQANLGGNHFARMTVHFVPEGSAFLLMVCGAVGVILLGRRRR